jgi:ABC-2 type transport system permease protein
MHRILVIARRDYIATVRTKAFLIGLIVAPILFGGGLLGVSLVKDKPDTRMRRIAIVDRTGALSGAMIEAARAKNAKELFDRKTGKQVAPRYVFEDVKPETGDPARQRLALSGRVRRGDLYAFLEIGPEALNPPRDDGASVDNPRKADWSASYFTNAGGIDEVLRWLSGPLNTGLRRVRLARLGIDAARTEDLTASIDMQRMSLVARDERTGEIRAAQKRGEMEGFFVPFGVVLLLGMIVMVGSSPMLSAVTQDKTQRVAEMLLGAATPFELMAGKVLAATGVSVTSSVFYVAGGTLALEGLGLTGMLPPTIIFWFYAYLLLDVVILCSFAAALGAACSTPQEAQNLAVVLLAPVMIPYFILVPVLTRPSGTLATVLSLFPPFTPMLMLLRQSLPNGVPAWQPWVGIAGVLAWAVVSVWAAARIFRVLILVQGKTPRPAELLRWAFRA